MPDEEDAPTIGEHQFEVSLRSVGPGSIVFGHIRLERELGRGGMGVVWLAHDELIDLPIALKFLPDVVARDAEATDELKRELKRGLSLTHPGIVRVYRFEQDATGAAIAMEYVDGPTLSSLKAKQVGGCFDAKEIEGWIEQCCAALDYAHHEARIVHRDLKPRNLMLTSKGKLKIADFGVATSISDTVSRVSVNKSSGTPPFMSPQQALGGDPSPSDDIYSLGATIFELLTGRPPFYQGNILAQVQQRVPPRMSERRAIFKITDKAEIPEVWEATVAACLAKHPEDRPQTALQVLECLRGKREPAVAEQAATRFGSAGEIDSTQTVAAVSSKDYATTKKSVTPLPPAPTPHDEREFSAHPPAPAQKKSSTLSWVALMVFVGIGIGAWQWQEYADRRAAEELRSRNAALSAQGETRILPPNTGKTGTSAMTAAEKAEVEREAALAVAHQIPVADQRWENSLQMKFVPVTGTRVLFSIYETRIDDYREFATEREKRGGDVWDLPEFLQGPTHPVVNVSWDDAQAFCQWLTDKERATSRLGSRQRYRLPTDEEWSLAVGCPRRMAPRPPPAIKKFPGSIRGAVIGRRRKARAIT
jgi:serine/threonine protein kinase